MLNLDDSEPQFNGARRSLTGSGDAELAIEQAHRCRRIARGLRADVERLGSELPADRALDALAAAGRMDAEAASWECAVATWRGWT